SAAANTPRAGRLPLLVAPEPTWKRTLFLLIAAGMVIAYLWGMHLTWQPAHPGTDQNGYLVGAKMYADHFSSGYTPPDPYAFVGKMWVGTWDLKTYYPKYPVGLSILYAIMLKLGGKAHGQQLAYCVNPIC